MTCLVGIGIERYGAFEVVVNMEGKESRYDESVIAKGLKIDVAVEEDILRGRGKGGEGFREEQGEDKEQSGERDGIFCGEERVEGD